MRVLHVLVNMNRGGAETFLMNIYRRMDRSLVQFDFLTSKPGVFDAEIRALGGTVHRIPGAGEVGPKLYQSALYDFFRRHPQYQIVHAHMDQMSGMVLGQAARAGLPVRIAHSHSTKSEGGRLKRLYKWYAGKQLRTTATDRFACSTEAGEWLFEKGKRTFFVLPNTIDTDRFRYSSLDRHRMRRAWQISSKALVLVQVGRMEEPKNHEMTLRLFAALKKKRPDARLFFVGDGPEKHRLRSLAIQLQVASDVHFTGIQDHVAAYLSAADLFIMPSFHEGYPVTLIEAQVSGLPCLVSDHITKEVDLQAGLLHYLPLHDTGSWIETIRMLLPPKRHRIPEAVLDQVDAEKTAASLTGFYLQKGKGAADGREDYRFHADV
ncbi:glycosyltransferase family 1 protein [Alkalicoccus chagannorensis]|uniref:glycosyltransferase family 1 protein n=1 Tax=Alkalicoccus chagannorensis TaxID=427072 RepID=UPI001FE173FB|nr:glycosyltransferase family 1 protein [Alkalicoccus chagannorensis]